MKLLYYFASWRNYDFFSWKFIFKKFRLPCIWYHWKGLWKCRRMMFVSCWYLDNPPSYSSFNSENLYISVRFGENCPIFTKIYLCWSQIRGDVQVNKIRLKVTKSNIRHRGAVYFNKLPADARGIETTKAFVNKLRRTAKAQEYY